MAAFGAMESGCSSRFFASSGHSCAQMKSISTREKARFSVLIGGLLFYHGRLYLTYLKRS